MEKNTDYRSNENNLKLRKIVYYILGIIEAFFAFRLVFKLLGANAGSTFVSLIYNISGVFMAPFSGIFRTAVTKGIETKSVLEPATIIAMIVYALAAYGIVRLIEISQKRKDKGIQ
ncbi:YggT family protein [Clostridium sp.]|uniref:YggT family protein n=1 Tax=Clostridium sp. TaxID=1506 RepID=UPI001A5A90B6|nr:YggT family protein [Clostridium sp.]MBK5237055.1 YggT family protein [Clostridium sp.]